MPTTLRTADAYYALSAGIANRAATLARGAASVGAAALIVAQHQAAQAAQADAGIAAMLTEQSIGATPDARINPLAFTTSTQAFAAMAGPAEVDWKFSLIVSSLVQDAGRAAQSVAVASRPRVQYVRQLSPPSCSRCAVLAGRVYRFSTGFLRHPGCDCIMVPTTSESRDLTSDPVDLLRSGQITGLSKADREALDAGADFGQVVNVRSKAAGLGEAGEVISRAGRPTPAGIFRMAGGDRDESLALLRDFGYII